MVFCCRQMLSRLVNNRLTFMVRELVPEHTAKDFGVILDTLTYEEHITKTASSCISCLSQISHTKQVFDKWSLLTIINSLLFSQLFYCSNVWANASRFNVSKLQSLPRNFAARIVTRTRKCDHITPVLKELKQLPVATQLCFSNAVMAFKCLSSRVPENLFPQFKKRGGINRRTTRS